MKLDTHVHTFHSGNTSIAPLRRIMRESYNTPEGVYQLARARGMDLVTITDHDQVSGALALGDRPDVIVGCEVTGVFPGDGVRVHLNVLGLTEPQHDEIQRRRLDVRDLLPYLRAQEIFTSLNHVASGINGPLTARHVAALLPWVDALEVINGSRLPVQNRTAACLAGAAGKSIVAGSDAHTRRGLGLTWTEVPGARTREEFLSGVRAGHARVGGREGSYFTLASDVMRFAAGFYSESAGGLMRRPLDARAHASLWGGLLMLPLIPIALAGAYLHFVSEERFNRDLLFDLVARPSHGGAQAAGLAA